MTASISSIILAKKDLETVSGVLGISTQEHLEGVNEFAGLLKRKGIDISVSSR
jgi:hypothetical protein